MAKIFKFTLLLISFLIAYPSSSERLRSFSLSEAIGYALSHNSGLKAVQAQMESSWLNWMAVAKSSGFKTDLVSEILADGTNITGNSRLSFREVMPTGGNINIWGTALQKAEKAQLLRLSRTRWEYGLSLSQSFFTDNVQKLATQRAEYEWQISRLTWEKAKRELIYRVEKSFWEVAEAKESLKIHQEAVRVIRNLVNLLKERFQEGVSSDAGLLEAEIQRVFTETNLRRAEGLQIQKRLELANLLGLPPNFEWDIIYVPLTSDSLMNKDLPQVESLQDHPSLQLFDWQIKLTEIDIKDAQRDFDFKVVFMGSYQSQFLEANLSQPADDWGVGLKAVIPLWDSHITDSNVAGRLQKLNALERQREQTLADLRTALVQNVEDLKSGIETAKLLSNALKYTQADLKLKNEQFLSGLTEAEDVLRAQQNLITAELNLINALIDIRSTLAYIYFLTDDEIYKQW